MTEAKLRPGEKVGAGFFVFQRNAETGRIHPSGFPFEHPTRGLAIKEATRLAASNPGRQLVVVEQVFAVELPEADR